MELTFNSQFTLIANFFHTTLIQNLPLIPISGGHFLCGNSYMTERSGLNACLFIYTISGKGKLHYRGIEKELLPGTAVVFDCSEYQYYATEEDNNWNFLWVHFQGTAFPSFDSLINEQKISLSYPPYEIIRTIFDKLELLSQEPCAQSDLIASQTLYQLLCELLYYKYKKSTDATKTPKESIAPAALYLRTHYKEDISISQLSQQHHISKYYFIRLFKMQYNQTPHEYLTNIRITQAKKLLTTTHLSIEQIATEIGFKDANSFIKVFKKKAGETPAKFRKAFSFPF